MSLSHQLTGLMKMMFPEIAAFSTSLPPPTREQEILLRQIITAGSIDHVAVVKEEEGLIWYETLNTKVKFKLKVEG